MVDINEDPYKEALDIRAVKAGHDSVRGVFAYIRIQSRAPDTAIVLHAAKSADYNLYEGIFL
jgi:hypothetical protein